MFAVILPALNFRGNRSPYLWWFHKLLSELGTQAGYVCGEDYFRDPSDLLRDGRIEAGTEMARAYHYRLPDREVLAQQLRADVPVKAWQSLESRYPGNPLAAFRHYCLEDDDLLRSALAAALDELSRSLGNLEAVITCVNCVSLKRLCSERGLPLIHVELGPLRGPLYLQTAYFDFSGVNGSTEAQHRFTAVGREPWDATAWADSDLLRSLFVMCQPLSKPEPTAELGVCLQVEDDSNMLCYANGHSTISMISHARRLVTTGAVAAPVLVRPHPSAQFVLRYCPPGLVQDESLTSREFIYRCKSIQTINSSVAVEAALLGRPVYLYGDSPLAFALDPETGLCNSSALAFMLLNYLTPWTLAFSPAYIRWRLGNPSETEIRERHLEAFMKDKVRLLEQRVNELEQALADSQRQFREVHGSLVWPLMHPLRSLRDFWARYRRQRSSGTP